MARQTKEQRLQAVHETALLEFDEIQSAQWPVRMECLSDRRFCSISGAQWEGPIGEQFKNRLKFEMNKVAQAVQRIENEYRNNRITVDFISKDGSETDELADTCDDLYRADEQDSCAEEAYDVAFGEGARGGFGAWRLRNCYEDEEDPDNDSQRIRIEPIFDADSCVFFDNNAKRQDKSDAKRCFVLTAMTPEAYEAEWGESPTGIEKSVTMVDFDWFGPDVVYIAEYYKVEERAERVMLYRAVTGEEQKYTEADFENDETLEETLTATGWELVSERKVKRKRVHKYIMDGGRILEDCGYIAGNCIPIIPFYGQRYFIDGIERCKGHVRDAKDAQRLKNMQISKIGEMAAVSPVSKPIFAPVQVVNHKMMWSQDPVENLPFLLADPLYNIDGSVVSAGPSAYTKSPEIPPAVAALVQMTEVDLKDILGNQQQGDKVVSNISGDAVEMIQQRLDMQTFIYVSNFAKAMRRCGEVWLSMAKDVYVEKRRKLKGIMSDGSMRQIELMRPMLEDGELEYENDISKARFDVAVDVGPSSSSKRQATVRSLVGMMQVTQDPETMRVLLSAALMNMEGEGLEDLRGYFRKQLVQIGAVKPSEEEAAQMQQAAANAQPDPQAQYLQAAAAEAAAKAQKAEADTVLALARAQESEASAAEKLAGIDRDDREQVIKTVEAISAAQNPVSTQPV